MARVVVIGAGVGGLAAAARLAAAGHDVTVCEQAEQVGGKLGRLEADGFAWDTGPSILTLPQVLGELFADTGAPMEDVLPLRRVDPVATYRWADGTTMAAPADLDDLCRAFDEALGAGAGSDWRRFATRAEAIWAASEGPFLRSPRPGIGTLARMALRIRDLRVIAPWSSLRDLAAGLLADPRQRMMAERFATYSGSDPRRAPAALASVVHAERAFGVWYPEGGLVRVGEAIADRAREHGVRIRTGADVVEVTLEGGRATGVQLADGEQVPADVVVANADATHLYRDLLAPAAGRSARRRLARTTPSLSGFVVLLGVRGRTPGLGHHTVAFPADYDAEFDAVFGPEPQPVPEPTLYVSVPEDPALAPAGDESWFVLVNAPRQGPVDWTAPGVSEAYADRIVDQLERRVAAVRDRITVRRVITPADLAIDTRAVGGAIYGTSSNGARAAFLRPANTSPVPGLYLVGGSAHPGGGLPLVVLSAAITARLIGPA